MVNVNDAFQSTLGRAPDEGGGQFWADTAQVNNWDQATLNEEIRKSASSQGTGRDYEYATNTGAYTPTPNYNVESAFGTVLDRAPDEGGGQFWEDTANLNQWDQTRLEDEIRKSAGSQGTGGDFDHVTGITRSDYKGSPVQTYKGATQYSNNVEDWYKSQFSREADKGGLANWQSALDQSTTQAEREAVWRDFITTGQQNKETMGIYDAGGYTEGKQDFTNKYGEQYINVTKPDTEFAGGSWEDFQQYERHRGAYEIDQLNKLRKSSVVTLAEDVEAVIDEELPPVQEEETVTPKYVEQRRELRKRYYANIYRNSPERFTQLRNMKQSTDPELYELLGEVEERVKKQQDEGNVFYGEQVESRINYLRYLKETNPERLSKILTKLQESNPQMFEAFTEVAGELTTQEGVF